MMNEPRRLPEIRVDSERVPPGARAVGLDYPENLGLRSVERDNPRNPLRQTHRSRRQSMFGDVGMIDVFYCFDCGQSASVVQGY